MEISEVGDGKGLWLSGPFDADDADRLIAAIEEKKVISLACPSLSSEEGAALAEPSC